MSTALLPRYVVAHETPEGLVSATYPDGEPVYHVGLVEERSRRAAEADADSLAREEPGAVFVVLTPAGHVCHRATSLPPCPF